MPRYCKTDQNQYLEYDNSHLYSGMKNLHASEHSPTLILGAMGEWRTFVQSGRDLVDMVSETRLTFLFLSYFKNKYSFHNFL